MSKSHNTISFDLELNAGRIRSQILGIVEDALRRAFRLGLASSTEGFNGECAYDQCAMDPEKMTLDDLENWEEHWGETAKALEDRAMFLLGIADLKEDPV